MDDIEVIKQKIKQMLAYGKQVNPSKYETSALFGKTNRPTEFSRTITNSLSEEKVPYSLSSPNKTLDKLTRPGLNRNLTRGMGGLATSALSYAIPSILGFGAEDPQVQQDNALLSQYGLLPGASTPPAPASTPPPPASTPNTTDFGLLGF